jgi:membrane-bound ClpP family serine protease
MITIIAFLMVVAAILCLMSAFHVPGSVAWGWLGVAIAILTLAFSRALPS